MLMKEFRSILAVVSHFPFVEGPRALSSSLARRGLTAQRRFRYGLCAGGLLSVALLPALQAASFTASFDAPADYVYSSDLITVTDGRASLIDRLNGTGRDGALSVSGTTNLSSFMSPGRAAADGVSYRLSGGVAAGSSTLTVTAAAAGLAPGDEILIIDRMGSASDNASVGTYGFYRVASVNGAQVTLSTPLTTAFAGDLHVVQVQRVPNYSSVTVSSGGILTASNFSGSVGGIVVFRVSGTLSIASGGRVDASGLGFRGGLGGAPGVGGEGGQSYAGIDSPGGNDGTNGVGSGGGGEGPSQTVGTKGGPGGLGAGGGGADGTDNSDDGAGGGGGGGHAGGGGGGGGGTGCGGTPAGVGGTGGAAGIVAGGGGLSTCGGGNGGSAGSPGTPGFSGCYDTSALPGEVGTASLGGGGGDTCGSHYGGGGGGGGRYFGNTALSQIFSGGGGGGGGGISLGQSGGKGGDGGGIVLIYASSVTLAGSIRADGQAGTVTNLANRGGSGGSGAGGTVWLSARTLTLSGTLSAKGGAPTRGNTSEAGGGGGADGRIRIDAETVNGNVSTSSTALSQLQAASAPAPGTIAVPLAGYPTSMPSICLRSPWIPTTAYLWTGFSAAASITGAGQLGFRLASDAPTYSDFQVYSSGVWVDASSTSFSSAAEVNLGLPSFPSSPSGLLWCASLISDGRAQVSLDTVAAFYELDLDADGIGDTTDNCPSTSNSTQDDLDGDGLGDLCDPDDENDGIPDAVDNCPVDENADQLDLDLDGEGDVCDDDDDDDLILDASDNCPVDENTDQADLDLDDVGDVCDSDDDGDGVADTTDSCPLFPDPSQSNVDGDALGDVCDPDDDNDSILDTGDNCPVVANADQADLDQDSTGDACDSDDDGDGIADATDNCAVLANSSQTDLDGDSLGDVCDPDDDNDGVVDVIDNCPSTANADQADLDGDFAGDLCDSDVDGDGVSASTDCDDLNAGIVSPLPYYYDADQDGLGDPADVANACQLTAPQGYVEDNTDNCPAHYNPDQLDTDADGSGNDCDEDDDGDSIPDATDNCPVAYNPDQADIDLNGVGNLCEGDADADGVTDDIDTCPALSNPEQTDSDGDGVGDACDPDVDGDDVAAVDDCDDTDPTVSELHTFYLDADADGFGDPSTPVIVCEATAPSGYVSLQPDNCPSTANPDQADTDRDGIGDACDLPEVTSTPESSPTSTPELTGTPGTDTPGTATPGTATPGTATPGTATPGTDTPGTDTPGTDTPGTDTPGTDTPGTDTPGTATPATGTPVTTTPTPADEATEGPSETPDGTTGSGCTCASGASTGSSPFEPALPLGAWLLWMGAIGLLRQRRAVGGVEPRR